MTTSTLAALSRRQKSGFQLAILCGPFRAFEAASKNDTDTKRTITKSSALAFARSCCEIDGFLKIWRRERDSV